MGYIMREERVQMASDVAAAMAETTAETLRNTEHRPATPLTSAL